MSDRLKRFFKERYPLGGLGEFFAHKAVPVHRHFIWYYFGGVTLAFLFFLFASGLLLLLYYRPSAEGAFESVKFIMTKVSFGWLVRSVHVWSANLAVFFAFVHLASTFFLKAYRPPRELTWVSGVCLLFVLMGFGFTGYLLPWNTLSFFATKVGTEIAGSIPLIGPALRTVLRGGPEVGDGTLARFFWMHVGVLPLCLLCILGVHLFMVQIQGMSKPLYAQPVRSMPFFPDFFLRDAIVWLILLGIVLSLSLYWPATLGEKADPFAPTPAGIQPEWYFLWMFQTLKMFPGHVLGVEGEVAANILMGLGALVLFLVPWLDRPGANGRSSWIVWFAGVLAIAYILGMTGYALWPAQP